MKLRTQPRRFVLLVVFSLLATTFGVAVRVVLTSYSQAIQRPVHEPMPLAIRNNLSQAYDDANQPPDDEIEIPSDEMLTVEETVGLSILPECVYPHLKMRANPQARPQLWDIIGIDDDGIWEFHMNAYLILGYVGDDTDAKKMVDTMRSYTGLLNSANQLRLGAMFAALGQMARRGVATAMRSLDEMSDVTYWKGRFEYMPSNLMQAHDLTPELQSLVQVIRAQSLVRGNNIEQLCSRVLLGIPNEKRRETMALQTDPRRLKRVLAEFIRAEQRKPTNAERQGLQLNYERRDYMIKATSQSQRKMRKDLAPLPQ